jgi:hypothetical protein
LAAPPANKAASNTSMGYDPYALKALPIDLRTKPPSLAILTLKHRIPSPVVQLFIEHLREAAKPIKLLARSRY